MSTPACRLHVARCELFGISEWLEVMYEYERSVKVREELSRGLSRAMCAGNSRDMKTFGPLYNFAEHAVEPRGGEAPPHPHPFPTNSNFSHCHFIFTNQLSLSIPAYDLGTPPISPKTLTPLSKHLPLPPASPKYLRGPPPPCHPHHFSYTPHPQNFPAGPTAFTGRSPKNGLTAGILRVCFSHMQLPYTKFQRFLIYSCSFLIGILIARWIDHLVRTL